MAKFSIDRFPVGFFDLSQDIAHQLPVDLIEEWTGSDHSAETALALLSRHLVFGTAISTDSAGLTSLTSRRSLIEIMALLNSPKEIIHACGKAVGGQAMGIWAADNSQMFYPFTWDGNGGTSDLLVSSWLEALHRINQTCEVKVGACIHSGSFFSLGGGLYGREADRLEKLAEEHSGAGETLLTEEFLQTVQDRDSFTVSEREDLRSATSRVWKLTGGPRYSDVNALDTSYPCPHSEAFKKDLGELGSAPKPTALTAIHERYASKRTVVIVEREKEDMEQPDVGLLNELSLSAAMTRIAAGILRQTDGTEIKTAGNLGIYIFTSAAKALEFARRMRLAFREQSVPVRIGVAQGEVYVFDLANGASDICGMPVNLASKLAQDYGEFGGIYLSSDVVNSVAATGLPAFSVNVSRVEIAGLVDRL